MIFCHLAQLVLLTLNNSPIYTSTLHVSSMSHLLLSSPPKMVEKSIVVQSIVRNYKVCGFFVNGFLNKTWNPHTVAHVPASYLSNPRDLQTENAAALFFI